MVGGWRLLGFGSWWRLAGGGWWWSAVGGWWSLGAVLKGGPGHKKQLGLLRTALVLTRGGWPTAVGDLPTGTG